MARFIPLNGHVEVRPIREGGVVQRADQKFEEKGVVISWDVPGLTKYKPPLPIRVGCIVYFDGWLAAKYNADTDDEKWLIKFDDIRAMEDTADFL